MFVKMLLCGYCSNKYKSIKAYLIHLDLSHSHFYANDHLIKCGQPNCLRKFENTSTLKSHLKHCHHELLEDIRKNLDFANTNTIHQDELTLSFLVLKLLLLFFVDFSLFLSINKKQLWKKCENATVCST